MFQTLSTVFSHAGNAAKALWDNKKSVVFAAIGAGVTFLLLPQLMGHASQYFYYKNCLDVKAWYDYRWLACNPLTEWSGYGSSRAYVEGFDLASSKAVSGLATLAGGAIGVGLGYGFEKTVEGGSYICGGVGRLGSAIYQNSPSRQACLTQFNHFRDGAYNAGAAVYGVSAAVAQACIVEPAQGLYNRCKR